MRIAYLDCFSGMSGDMFLGALLDAGVPSRVFEDTVAALDIGARLEVSRVVRDGITAAKVDVYSHGEKDLPREEYWERREQAHQHEHSQEHGHHEHAHRHQHEPVELREHNFTQEPSPAGVPAPHEHGRGLKEICEIIRQAAISDTAKNTAIAILQEAARRHGLPGESPRGVLSRAFQEATWPRSRPLAR